MSTRSERGIAFDPSLVQAIVEGRKTQTRRPAETNDCPFGSMGGLLWVKERVTFAGTSNKGMFHWFEYQGPYRKKFLERHEVAKFKLPKIGSSFGQAMPKCLARIWLEITDVSTEALHDISLADGNAEKGREVLGFMQPMVYVSWRPDARFVVR